MRNGAVGEKVREKAAVLLRTGNNPWPEFLRFLFKSASNGTPELKESALQIFGSVPGIFRNQQSQYFSDFKQMLKQCMADLNYPVQFQAIKSLTSFLVHHSVDKVIQQHFEVVILISPLFINQTAN